MTHQEDFAAWFREHYADVARFCARRCESAADAEDAATETFAIAWRRRDAIPPGDAARPWLFGVARKVLANQQRARARRLRLHERLSRVAAPHVPAPDGHFAEVAAALRSLPAAQRELLVMTAWDGLSVAEIATVLSVPAPVVSRRLHRARRRLAAALEPGATPSSSALSTTT